MLKKILVAVATLLASSSIAFAETIPYLGADIGFNSGNVKLKDTSNNNTNYGYHGYLGGLFAGIGTDYNQNTYLGVEAFGKESSAVTGTKTISTPRGLANDKIRMRYSYGVSFIPGYKFTEGTMLYMRLGVIRSRYELHQTLPPASATSNTDRNTATGAEFGLGAETCINRDWAIRGEYDYSTYRSFTSFSNKITPRDSQFNIGLIYKFN